MGRHAIFFFVAWLQMVPTVDLDIQFEKSWTAILMVIF